MKPLRINFISLGCPKNLVDSEAMVGALKGRGFEVSFDMDKKADCAVVNTCGFIKDAKEESIDTICELIELKKQGMIKKLLVAGCLSERYKKELKEELKEVDAFAGVNNPSEVSRIVERLLLWGRSRRGHPIAIVATKAGHRVSPPGTSPSQIRLTPPHYAYIKLSEGCLHHCSFCTIPKIRGRHRSRPMGEVIEEAEMLLDDGVKEINLIGQDITSYGMDLCHKPNLTGLLKKLAKIRSLKKSRHWIRLLYAYPKHIDDGLINLIASEPSICKYIDMPLQHINDKILKLMRRGIDKKKTLGLIDKLRKCIPDVSLRTSFIVGFPGEGDKEFRELIDFIKETRFERLGAFIYSNEEGTPAYNLRPQVSEKEKRRRFDEVMSLQRDISNSINQEMLGRRLEVLIDERDDKDKNIFIGRTQADAPEVDGCVYVKTGRRSRLNPGDFVNVKITDTYEYDLVGEEI